MRRGAHRTYTDEFIAFSKICFEKYKKLVKYSVAFNEINLINADLKELYTELYHQMLTAAKAVKVTLEIDEQY